jgi:hypothetical protein
MSENRMVFFAIMWDRGSSQLTARGCVLVSQSIKDSMSHIGSIKESTYISLRGLESMKGKTDIGIKEKVSGYRHHIGKSNY